MEGTSERQSYRERLTEYLTQLAAAEEEARTAQARIAFLKERIDALNELIDELDLDQSDRGGTC